MIFMDVQNPFHLSAQYYSRDTNHVTLQSEYTKHVMM
jgi:hypothetical protein